MSSQVPSLASLSPHRLSPLTSDSLSSVISVSSSSDSETGDLCAMSSGPPSPLLPRLEASVAPATSDSQATEKHPEHFHPGGDVKILIGRTLYQLHGDVLARQSGWYRAYREAVGDDSTLPSGWTAQPGPFCTIYVHHGKEKVQFERPRAVEEQTGAIVVEDITPWAMDLFLAILYPTDFMSFGLTGQEEWTAVLKVAHMWDCSAIRTLAADRLDRELGDPSCAVKAFDRLIVARKYTIEAWVKPALASLVERSAPLDAEEIEQMLPEDVAYVAAKREDRALHKDTPSLVLFTPEPPMISPLPRLSPRRVEAVAEEGHAPSYDYGPYFPTNTLQSPATLSDLRSSCSPTISILRAPSPPQARSPPMFTTSSRASSPMESPTRSIDAFRPWTPPPPPVPNPPRAWSITPASSDSRQSRPETLTRVRSQSPSPEDIPTEPHVPSPNQNPFTSPPRVQQPPFVPSPPRSTVQSQSPYVLTEVLPPRQQPRRWPGGWPSMPPPAGTFEVPSSRPSSMAWPYQASPSTPPWAIQRMATHAAQRLPPRPTVLEVADCMPVSMPPPPPPELPSSRPIAVPRSANTLF
ncbi:unnamed protein product [Peniophora sp. CBMAI 1063]|nr:unnamed protein product [Peniophora sp. CBMAI 1063]